MQHIHMLKHLYLLKFKQEIQHMFVYKGVFFFSGNEQLPKVQISTSLDKTLQLVSAMSFLDDVLQAHRTKAGRAPRITVGAKRNPTS